MKTRNQLTFFLFLHCLLFLSSCVSGSLPNNDFLTSLSSHEQKKFYAVDNVRAEEFSLVKSALGSEINLIITTIDCTDLVGFEKLLHEAEKNNLQLIVWPIGGGHQNTPWNYVNGEWNLDEGLDLLQYAERYVAKGGQALYAMLMTHEPFWNFGEPFTSGQMKQLYTALKTEAPHIRLFAYIDSLKMSEGNVSDVVIEEGIADIVGIWWHLYGQAEGAPDPATVLQFIQDDINLIRERHLQMEILFAVQCFGWQDYNYRMPDAEELGRFANDVLQVDGLSGVIWYSWNDYEAYSESLAKDRYDRYSVDRWKTIRYLNGNH